ncbi:Proteasome subunit beta type-1 [Cladochytrium tenue]|nr:Proteasome subunit beta type-1 [Cladochytrium tenue]
MLAVQDFNHSTSPVALPVEHRFSPYTDNGGTTLAIAGEDFCVVAGKGCVFSYDPVGNYEKRMWQCAGSAGSLIQPFLDSQIGQNHQVGVTKRLPSLETARNVARDAFSGATERDIYTGDHLQLFVVTRDGVNEELFDLKKD